MAASSFAQRDRCPVERLLWLVLCERGYPKQFLLGPRSLPVNEEFLLVDCGPFDHEPHRARRQATGEDGQVADLDQSNFAAVLGMKMGRIVIVKEYLDDDSEETADLRHAQDHGVRLEKHPPAFCSLL